MRRVHLSALLVLISLSLLCQESNTSKTSFSVSYVTPYVFLLDWELGIYPVLLNTEANIYYKPFEKVSFATGIGFLRDSEKYDNYPPSIGGNLSYKKVSHLIRVPIQINYHFNWNPGKTDCYAKFVYSNILFFDKVARYEDEIATSEEKALSYIPSIGLGVGAQFRRDKTLGIILEGMCEKHLRFDGYSDAILSSAKIGIIF